MRPTAVLTVLPLALAAPNAVKRDTPAPLLEARADASVIPGKYIVKLREGSSIASVESAMSILSVPADVVYENVFNGFAGALSAKDLEMIRNHPEVSVDPKG